MTSARKTYDAGFSLIEMMAVLVIIGLMSAAVMFTMPGAPDDAARISQKLESDINALSREALVSGKVKAAGFSDSGYVLYSYEGRDWRVVHRGSFEDLNIALVSQGEKVEINKTAVPQILFEPVGLATPFEVALQSRDEEWKVSGAPDMTLTRQKAGS